MLMHEIAPLGNLQPLELAATFHVLYRSGLPVIELFLPLLAILVEFEVPSYGEANARGASR